MIDLSSLVIIPYISVGPIKFGMTADEVVLAIGLPDQVDKNHAGARVDFYGPINVGYANTPLPTVNHIGGGKQATSASIRNVPLFLSPPEQVLELLRELDGSPYLYLGFVVFLELGITLTGFHDDDEDQLAFSAFPRGAWDHRIPKMKRF